MLRLITTFFVILSLATCLKISPITQLHQDTFYNQTQIFYDESLGKLHSSQNVMVYFLVQGQQNVESNQNPKKEFERARYSYLKAEHSSRIDKLKEEQSVIKDEIDGDEGVPIQILQEIEVAKHNKVDEPNKFQLDFFVVRCPSNHSKYTSQTPSICHLLPFASTKPSSLVTFFSQNSQLLSLTSPINEDNILYFISKLKENRKPQFNYRINLDEELSKIATVFQVETKTLKQKALGFLVGLKRYLTWDALKFFAVFIIVPFLFGYVSTKMQERANRKKLEKYQANLEQEPKQTVKQAKPVPYTKKLKSQSSEKEKKT